MSSFGSQSSLLLQPGSVYKVARNGLATFDAVFEGPFSGTIPFSQGETSTIWSNTVLLEVVVKITGKGCDRVEFHCHYEGYDASFSDDAIRLDGSLEVSMSQEPIETHPRFLSFAGGRGEEGRPANQGKNGALYREAGEGQYEFDFFLHTLDDEELNPFSGIKSYLFPNEVYTQTRIDTTWPSVGELAYLGKILDSLWLDENVPELPTVQNWLYSGVRVRNIGNVYFEAQRTAMASGPRGWQSTIYGIDEEG